MSHITLLQYVTQLQNLGLTQPQINAAVQEWQKTHTPAETQELSESIEQVKVTSEGKTSDVGTQGASPTSTTELVPESSPSLDGLSESQSPVIKNIIARNKAKKKYEENIKQVDFLIEDLNKTGDFSKIYAFNEENPGYVNIDAIKEFEKKYNDHKAKVQKEREKYTTVVDFGEVYSPGDGYEYKFEINKNTNQIDYYAKSTSQKDFQLVDPNSNDDEKRILGLSVVNKLGHLGGELQQQLEAILEANRIRSERLKADVEAYNQALKDQKNTIQLATEENVLVDYNYFIKDVENKVNKWILDNTDVKLNLEEQTTSYRSKLTPEKQKAIREAQQNKLRGLPYDEDLLSQLETQALSVVGFDEIKPSVEKAVNALYPEESRADIMRMYEIKNELQKKINSLPPSSVTVMIPGGGAILPTRQDLERNKIRDKGLEKIFNSDLYKELLNLNSKYAPKGKKVPTKPSASEFSIGLSGTAGQVLTPQITATPEAIAEFQNKLKIARETTPDILVGAGSGEMQTEKIIFDRVFEQTVKEDPFIRAKLYELKIAARPLLEEKRKELAKKYDLENQDDYNRAIAELDEYSKFLIQDKLYSSDEFKERFRELSVVASSSQIDILKQQGRENDPFFKAMDELRQYGQAGKMLANIEFLAKGFKRVQENFNGIQLSLAVGNTASSKKKKQALEKAIEAGEISLEDRFVESSFWKNLWGTNKAMNVKELLDYYADEIEKNKQDIIIQLEDLEAVGDDLMLYNEVDENDLWLTRTTGHLMESTPYMLAALAGTAASMIPGVAPAVVTTISTLGTGFMMLDFYGAQWYSTFLEGAEAEAKRKGINLEQIPKQEKRDFLIQALESGKYDAKAESAAAGALMGLTERFGLSKSFAATSKALGLTKDGIFSLIKGEWKQIGKKFIRSGLSFGESYLSEFATELSQTGIDQAQRSFSLGVNKMNFKEMWEAGTIGGNVALLMPGAAAVGTQTSVEIRNTARKLAVNFDFGNFSKSSEAVNNWFIMAKQELTKRFDNGKNPEYSRSDFEADMDALSTTYNTRLKMPSNATPEIRTQLLDLMTEKNRLEAEVKRIDDKDLAANEIINLNIVKNKIQSLVKQEKNIQTLTTSKARQAAVKVAEQLGYKYESFQTQEAINNRVEELIAEGANPAAATDYGQAIELADGSTVVLINDRAAAQDNVFTTDQHEILHPFLKQTFKNNPDAAVAFGKSLMQEIISNPDITISPEFESQFNAYLNDKNYSAANTWEEVIPLVSEALTNGDIKVKGNLNTVLAKIKEFIQNLLGRAKQPLKIRFDEGSDVLAFLRDYNKTIAKGEGLTQAQLDVAQRGAEGALVTDAAAIAAAETGVAEVDAAQEILTEQDANRIEQQPLAVAAKKRLDQDIGAVETTPEQAIRNKELMQKILEGDVSAANTLVEENSGLILPLLNFNPDITQQSGVTSEDVLQAVADMLTPGMVDIVYAKIPPNRKTSLAEEYSKEKGEVSTFLGRLAQRRKEIYTAAGLDPNKFNLVAIDASTKQIVDEESDSKPKPEKEVATTQIDPREFGPVTEGNKLKEVENIVKLSDKERLTFKQLASKYFDKVSQALFGMPGKKVRGNVSLKYADVKGQPSSSEASKLQNIFKNVEDVRSFIKSMPLYNVATSQTVIDRQGKKIDVSKDVRGRSIAINPTVLKKFYQPVTRAIEGISNKSGRSLGSTSQTQVYELKPEYRGRITKQTIEGLQKSLGITKGQLSVPIKGAARTEFGSLLTGLSKMYVDNLINTVGRSKLTTDQAKADTGAGKSNALAKKRKAENVFQAAISGVDALGFNRFNYEYDKVIPQLLKGEDGVSAFDMKTPEGVKKFLDYAISSGITKRVPRELWTALAFTSENLLKDNTKQHGFKVRETRRLLESLQEDPSDTVFEIEGAVIGKKGIPRGYKGNLPFRNSNEARQWITDSIEAEYNRLKAEGLTDAEAKKQADALFPKKGTSEFSNLFTKTDVFTNKNNLETQLDNPSFVKSQDAKIDELKKFFTLLQNEVMRDADGNLDFEGVAFVGAILSSSSAGTSHFLRNAAPMRFYQQGYRQAGSSNVTIEHTMPATLVGKYLFMSAVEGNIDAKFKVIKDNYVQGPLLEVDDNKLRGRKANGESFDYREQMPEFWQETDSVWSRYFNINVITNKGGINPATIMFGKGESALSKFNIMADGTAINNNTKKGLPEVEKQNNSYLPSTLSSKRKLSTQQQINQQGVLDNALSMGRRVGPKIKKIRIFDFDDTLARSKSKVIVTMPYLDANNEMADVVARRMFKEEFKNLPSFKQNFNSLNANQQRQVLQSIPGETIEINATQFAEQAADLEAIGATFDFSQFEQVVDGKKGPLFDIAKKIADARGTEDLFILTARPQEAAGPIKEFMKALGIDIPIGNITGLADGTAQAKAMWVAGKAAEGYNDFYFADDAIKNVRAVKEVLNQIDVKSKVQQAKSSKRRTFDTIINDMIESSSGIESYKTFSAAKARTIGKDKGRFDWLTLSSSAEDFKGLLYRLLGNGKKGEAQYEFLKTNLIDVYNRAEDSIIQAKIAAANDFMALKSQFPGIPKTLETETGVGKFTYQHALRVYMWTQQGMSIPGLSKADARKLNKFITDDAKLKSFADGLIGIQKSKPYPEPGKNWLSGNLTTDIIGGINKVNRAEYQQEFRENVDIIFSPQNLNKMEAAYGTRWRKALENSLARMKAGTNRLGYNDQTSAVLDWVNNSVGAVMFLNTRSALLQTISAVNFLNWGDNNIIKAGAAFANQKQYWSDFMFLMNSDYLVQRRNGLKINVSESEIADAVKDSQNKPKAAIAYLLSKGFVFTRYADSFAIATGGSTFYRNRIKKYLKEGMDQKLAEQKAFEDFKDVAEESQQSSDPSKISMQQASGAGRVILNWANTPMQYIRIQKRDLQDLIAGRGDPKVKIARIAYYGVVQNLIFNALQQALFVIAFGDDDEEEDPKKKARDDKRIARVANGMIDSQLKGLGIAGMVMLSAKNTIMKIYEESKKNRPEYEAASIEALSFSPAISSKYRKLVGGLKSFSWNMKEIKEKGFSLDNPAYLAGAQILTAFTNIPIDRVMKKANNIRGILSEQSKMWQKVAMTVGFSTWDIGLPYYGGWDKPVEPTEAERKKQEIEVMKRDTKTADQVQMLLDLGLTKKQIKALRYEDARVKKIIELQNKKKKDE